MNDYLLAIWAIEKLIDIWEKKKEICSQPWPFQEFQDHEILSLYKRQETIIKEKYREFEDKDINQLITIKRNLKIKYYLNL